MIFASYELFMLHAIKDFCYLRFNSNNFFTFSINYYQLIHHSYNLTCRLTVAEQRKQKNYNA